MSHNKSIIELISTVNSSSCNVTYNYDEDINTKINTFQGIYGAFAILLKRKL
jgi:hypothetical protein